MLPIPRSIRRIAIFRALQLGDLLCAIPAIRAVQRHFVHARITLIGLPWAKTLVDRFPDYFQAHLHFPGAEGLPEQEFNAASTENFFRMQKRVRYDLLLQMHGSGTIVNRLVEKFNAGTTAGFHPWSCPRPGPLFIPYPDHLHEVRRHLALVRALGIETGSEEMEFPVNEHDRTTLQKTLSDKIREPYVVIHPGARDPNRRWSISGFSRIAEICQRSGYKVLLTGTSDERPVCEMVAAITEGDPQIVAGMTELGTMGALIESSRMVISNCTGIAHLAAALKKDSLIISLEKEPWRWAPLNTELHRTIVWKAESDMENVRGALQDKLALAR